jgi:ankyrin repeat protein
MRKELAAVAMVLVLAGTFAAASRAGAGSVAGNPVSPDAADTPQAAPPGDSGQSASPPRAPAPGGSIVPKPQPLAPAPFTLEQRYLDAATRADTDVLAVCLDKGVDLGAKDDFGRSALLLAAMSRGNLKVVELLRARGLSADDPDNQGRAPLAYAAGNGDLALVSYLIENGAVVDRKDWQGRTPLFDAAVGGNTATVERLLEAKAAINARDNFEDTPLIGACAKGNDAIARLLVERGADPTLKDQEDRTARERAAEGAVFCRALPSTAPGAGVTK